MNDNLFGKLVAIFQQQHWALQLSSMLGAVAAFAVMSHVVFAASAQTSLTPEQSAAHYQLLIHSPSSQWNGNTLAQDTLLQGDVNNDGAINEVDYSLLNSNLGQEYPPADFDKDGLVDVDDLDLLVSKLAQ